MSFDDKHQNSKHQRNNSFSDYLKQPLVRDNAVLTPHSCDPDVQM